jgi:hypothetical protein
LIGFVSLIEALGTSLISRGIIGYAEIFRALFN